MCEYCYCACHKHSRVCAGVCVCIYMRECMQDQIICTPHAPTPAERPTHNAIDQFTTLATYTHIHSAGKRERERERRELCYR